MNASTDVTFRRVKLRPAAGKDGKARDDGHELATVAQTDTTIAGHNASDANRRDRSHVRALHGRREQHRRRRRSRHHALRDGRQRRRAEP